MILSLLFSAAKRLKESVNTYHANQKEASALVNLCDSSYIFVEKITNDQGELSNELSVAVSHLIEVMNASADRLKLLGDDSKAKQILKSGSIATELKELVFDLQNARQELSLTVSIESRGQLQSINKEQAEAHAKRETDKQKESDRLAVRSTFRKLAEVQPTATKHDDEGKPEADAIEWLFKSRQADLRPIIAEASAVGPVSDVFDPLVKIWKLIQQTPDDEDYIGESERPKIVLEAATSLQDMFASDQKRFNSLCDQYVAQGIFSNAVPYVQKLLEHSKQNYSEISSWCQMIDIVVRDNEMRSVSLAWEHGSELMIKIVKTFSTNRHMHVIALRTLWSLSKPRGASKHVLDLHNSLNIGAEVFSYTMMLWSTNDEILQTGCSALRRLAAHESANAEILAKNGVASAVANFLKQKVDGYSPMTLTVTMGFEVLTTMIANSASAGHVMDALGGFQPILEYLNEYQSFPYVFFSGCNLILRLLATLTNSVQYVDSASLVQQIVSLTERQLSDIIICTPLVMTLKKLSSMDDQVKQTMYDCRAWELLEKLIENHGYEKAFGLQCTETMTNLRKFADIRLKIAADHNVMYPMYSLMNNQRVDALVRVNIVYLTAFCLLRQQLEDLPSHTMVAGYASALGEFRLTKIEEARYNEAVYELFTVNKALAIMLSDHVSADIEMKILAFAILFASDQISTARHNHARDTLRENKKTEEKGVSLATAIINEDKALCNLIFSDDCEITVEQEVQVPGQRVEYGIFQCCAPPPPMVATQLKITHNLVQQTIELILSRKAPIRRSGYLESDPSNLVSCYRMAYAKSNINYDIFFTPTCFRAMIYALALRGKTRDYPYCFWNYMAFDDVCHMMECMSNDFSVQFYGILGLRYILVDLITSGPPSQARSLTMSRGITATKTALLLFPRSDVYTDRNLLYSPTGTLNVIRATVILNIFTYNIETAQGRQFDIIENEMASLRATCGYLPNIKNALSLRNSNWNNPGVPSVPTQYPRAELCSRCGNQDKKKNKLIVCGLCGLTMCKDCTHEFVVNLPYCDAPVSICKACFNCEPLVQRPMMLAASPNNVVVASPHPMAVEMSVIQRV